MTRTFIALHYCAATAISPALCGWNIVSSASPEGAVQTARTWANAPLAHIHLFELDGAPLGLWHVEEGKGEDDLVSHEPGDWTPDTLIHEDDVRLCRLLELL